MSAFTYPVGFLSLKGAPIPTEGLIGEWLFEGNADDTSGNGNNGSIVKLGGTYPLLTTGKNGGANSAFEFGAGGSDSGYISFGDPVLLRDLHANDFSISAWLRSFRLGTSSTLDSFWSSWSGNKGVLIRAVETGMAKRALRFDAYFNTTIMTFITDDVLIQNVWSHAAFIFDFTTKTAKIYIDGTETSYITTTAGSGTILSDSGVLKEIGMLRPSTNTQSWLGDMDLLRLYDKQLTQDEITILANE